MTGRDEQLGANAEGPFRGATPFSETHRDLFFGRKREASMLADLLLVEQVVVVHAPSGSGKTSLLQAFLIPHFRDRGYLTQHAPIRPTDIDSAAWSAKPTAAVGNALLASFGIHVDPLVDTSASLLGGVVRDDVHPDSGMPPRILIVVDQTEEIFSSPDLPPFAQRVFFDYLAGLVSDRSIWLVMAVREDYLARLLAHGDRFDKNLRARFAVPLISAETACEIIDSTLRAFGCVVSESRIGSIACVLVRGSIAPSQTVSNAPLDTEALKPDTVSEQLVEPLFLQLVAKHWWEQAKGDAAALESATVSMRTLDTALGRHLTDSFQFAARHLASSPGDPEHYPELELRLDVADRLVDRGLRKQGCLSVALQPGGHALERRGILRRPSAHSERVELAHDQLAPTLLENNRRWIELLPFGALEAQYERWRKSQSPQDLLSIQAAFHIWRRRRELSPKLSTFLKRSVQSVVKAYVGLGVVLGLLLAFIGLTSYIAWTTDHMIKDLKAAHKQQKDRFLIEALSFSAQRHIARSYSALQSHDGAAAATSALAALHTARRAENDRIDLLTRAEGVLGRVVALNPVIDRGAPLPSTDTRVVDAGADGSVTLCDNGSATRLNWSTRSRTPRADGCHARALSLSSPVSFGDFTLSLVKDRGHYVYDAQGQIAGTRNSYSFAEITFPGTDKPPRRVWPTFGAEAIVRQYGAELDFPPLEVTNEVAAGNIRRHGSVVTGVSISSRGRVYGWITTEARLRACATAKLPGRASQNDPCRVLELDRPTQLFSGRLTAVAWDNQSAVAGTPGHSLYATSDLREIVRLSWRPRALRPTWLSERLAGNRRVDASSIFADPLKHRIWLVNNGAAPLLLSTESNEPLPKTHLLRALWCPDEGCVGRRAIYVAGNGAMGWFDLDETKVTEVDVGNTRKHGAASLYRLNLWDVEPLTGGIAIGVGDAQSASGVAPKPIVVRISASGKATFNMDAISAPSLQMILETDRPKEVTRAGSVIVLRTHTGRIVLCSLATNVTLSECRVQNVSGSATAIAAWGDHSGRSVIAIGLADGRIQLLDASGLAMTRRLPATESRLPSEIAAHFGPVRSLLVFRSEDESLRLTSGGADGRVKSWLLELPSEGEFEVGVAPIVISTHAGEVTTLLYADGHLYSSGQFSETYRALLDSDELVRLACRQFSVGSAETQLLPDNVELLSPETLCR